MRKTLAILLLSVLGWSSSLTAGEIDGWELHKDGTIIVVFRTIDKDGVHLSFHQYVVKRGAEKKPDCNEIQLKENEVYLMTQEERPSVYIIDVWEDMNVNIDLPGRPEWEQYR